MAIIDDVASAVTAWATSMTPILVAIAVAVAAFWLARIGIRLIKSFANGR